MDYHMLKERAINLIFFFFDTQNLAYIVQESDPLTGVSKSKYAW
jgi:hypothetical protein